MYSQDCPLHVEHVLGAEQLEKLATNHPNSTRFCEYLNQHWLQKAKMWCIGNRNILRAGQDTNVALESFHNNMK